MRLLGVVALLGVTLGGVSAAHDATCTVKSTSTSSSACKTFQSASVEIASGGLVNVPIPTFDTTTVPAGAILDAVYFNWIDADFTPSGTFVSAAGATNVLITISITAGSWSFASTLESTGSDRGFLADDILSATAFNGGLSGASGITGQTLCIPKTDSASHQTKCFGGSLFTKDFKAVDNTWVALPAGQTKAFTANYQQTGTYVYFQGPITNTATSGIEITNTPAAGYSSNGPSTWNLAIVDGANADVPKSVSFSGAFQADVGQSVTVNAAVSLKLRFEVQYDYHLPSVGGDPQFSGFQGQSFQVHGAPESYFALISAPKYYVNARFDYLSTGRCDYNETQCFTHPGTYMGLLYVGMRDTNVLIQSGPHATGFAGVYVNDREMTIGDRIVLSSVSESSYIQLVSSSKLILALDTIILTVTNSDHFVNFDLALTDKQLLSTGAAKHVMPHKATPSQIAHNLNKWYGSYNPLHGLIGQTWRNVKYADNKYYQGDVTEYQLDKIVDHTFLYFVFEP